jgi:YD repeat-containing protein
MKRSFILRNTYLAFVALALMLSLGLSKAVAQSGYSYRRAVIIDHTKVPNTDQSNFPVLISGAYSYLATVANGGRVQNANGYDILLTSDAAGSNKLDHEIESYNAATGAIAFWVRIPALSHTADTVIYLQYGNSAVTTSQENKTGVWDSNYKGVWHLGNGSSLSLADSTSNANNGTNTGATATAGQIGEAAQFNGSNQSISIGALGAESHTSMLTMSVWASRNSTSGLLETFSQKGTGNGFVPNIFTNGPKFVAEAFQVGGGGDDATDTASFNTGQWYYVLGTFDGSNVNLYVNGVKKATTAYTSNANNASANSNGWTLGNYTENGSGFNWWNGSIDEARLSSVVRSADWIAAEYNNQSSPVTFYSVGGENTVAISISPTSGSLYAGQTQQFTGTVINATNTTVTWSISPSGVGSINSTGLYTAPTPNTTLQTVTVTATSVADNTKSASATVTLNPSPQITNLSPNSGAIGFTFTVAGSNFGATQGASTITMNGTAAAVSSWSSTSITAVVPSGATSGNVVVTTASGGPSNGVNFTVTTANGVAYAYDELGRLVGVTDPSGNAAVYVYDAVGNILSIQRYTSAQVSIISFTPKQGVVGTSVTILGTGFSATANQNTVKFNGTTATVTSANSSQIVTSAPAGATTGAISVTTPAGSATSSASFTVKANSGGPTITGFTPSIGVAGTAVNITGTNFDSSAANDHLQFNISKATVTSATATSLATTAPAATGSGRISLNTPAGVATSTQDFFIPFGTHVAGDVGYTGRVTIGGTQAMTLGAGKIGILVFDANRGQRVDLQLSGSTLGSNCVLYVLGPDGSQLSTASCNTGATFAGTVFLPTTATYAIGIDPAGSSGSITVSLVDASDVMGTISIDGPSVTATTNVTGQRAGLTFSATAFQRTFLKVTNVSMTTGAVQLQKPDGSTQTGISINNNSGYVFYMDTQTLATTGTYTLWLQGASSVGSATLQLTSVPPDFTAAITLGGPVVRIPTSGNTAMGQNAVLTFTAAAGQKVSLSLSNDTYPYLSCQVTLLNASGNTVTWGYCDNGLIDPVTLATAGAYTILVDPYGTATGTTTVGLNNDTDVTGTIVIDGAPVTATTTAAGQDARLTFSATAGQRIVAYASSVSNPSATVQLLRPDGSTQSLIGINNNTAGQVFFMDTQTLATTGTYTLWIQHSGSNVGSATLQLNSVPADFTGTITLGGAAVRVPASGNTAVGQNASLTFSGTAGQRVSMTFSNATYGGYVFCVATMKDPSGTAIASGNCGSGAPFIEPVTLATTGTYTIFIDPQGAATGTTTVTLNNDADVTGTISIDGASVTATTTVPGQDARLTFSAPAGQRIVLQVSNVSIPQALVQLLKPDGTMQTYVGINNGTSGQVFFIDLQTLATAGTYTLWMQHQGGGWGSATLQLNSVPADFTASITINGAAVRIPVTGNNALGQNANLTLSATAGQQVTLHISNDTYTPNTGCLLTVKDPSGNAITSNYCGIGMPTTIGPFTTSTTGTYSIYVDPQYAAVGTITIGLTSQ